MGVNFSPIPSAKAVPLKRQKGTSAPSSLPILKSSSLETGNLNRFLIPINVAAQSVLPPASPAEIGIFLLSIIFIPSLMLYVDLRY